MIFSLEKRKTQKRKNLIESFFFNTKFTWRFRDWSVGEINDGGKGGTEESEDWDWGVSDGRGGESINFLTFVKLVNSVWVDWVWLSLTEFDGFQVFNLILHVIYRLTCKSVLFYESNHDFDNHGHTYRLIYSKLTQKGPQSSKLE
jgi:hypothetical protein